MSCNPSTKMCHPSVPDILQDFLFLMTTSIQWQLQHWALWQNSENVFSHHSKAICTFKKCSVILVKVTNIVIGKGQFAFLQEQSNNSWQMLCILQPLAFSFTMSDTEQQDVQGLSTMALPRRWMQHHLAITNTLSNETWELKKRLKFNNSQFINSSA